MRRNQAEWILQVCREGIDGSAGSSRAAAAGGPRALGRAGRAGLAFLKSLSSRSAALLCILCVGGWMGACLQKSGGRAAGEHGIDISERFFVAGGGPGAAGNQDSLKKHFPVTRRGRQLEAIVLVAPVTVRAGLAGFTGRFKLHMLVSPVFNVGDGFMMDIASGNADGRTPVGSRYLDAGREAGDRDWVVLEFSIDAKGGPESFLEIRISGGPQGDLDADWAALAEVRIVKEGAAR